MLKRLELVGFKSFAEKTSFDFGPGVTAIVGPNGSGKSNVVDAVRWILGEQSAKSLRGGEMTDVIFNGSSTRRSLGLAEVTLTLDNAKRALNIDSDEVQVTRRVYRSGEGEYLINRQPSRLRDIKEMFLGSGAGGDAYCIIEQGRVEALLQSSTRDRRIIFEEAAGISRFKAKKIETLRKLENVDQNLLRLHDLTDEVERQLRAVQQQAAKAQKYQELMTQLRELRVAISLAEFKRLDQERAANAAIAAETQRRLESETNQASAAELAVAALDGRRTACEREERDLSQQLAQLGSKRAAAMTSLDHERAAAPAIALEIEQTQTKLLEQLRALRERQADLAGAVQHVAEQRTGLAAQQAEVRRLDGLHSDGLQRLQGQRDALRQLKEDVLEQMRQVARLHNEHVSLNAQAEGLRQQRQRMQQKTSQLTLHLTQVGAELKQLQDAEHDVQTRVQQARKQQTELTAEQDQARQALATLVEQQSNTRDALGRLESRVEILDALERSQEGLSQGVRDVLNRAALGEQPLANGLVGVVADLVAAPREYASLVDAALGDHIQALVVRDKASRIAIETNQRYRVAGRATFLPLYHLSAPQRLPWVRRRQLPLPMLEEAPESDPRVLARGTELVDSDHPESMLLLQSLLGSTYLVATLEDAVQVAARWPGRRFLTKQGDVLEPDGTCTLNAATGAAGILSRRSELRSLQHEATQLRSLQKGQEDRAAVLREQLQRLAAAIERATQEGQVLKEQMADLRSRVFQLRQRHEGLTEEASLGTTELAQLEAELTRLQLTAEQARESLCAGRERERQLQEIIRQREQQLPLVEVEQAEAQQATQAAQVEAARLVERVRVAEQRHEELRQVLHQAQRDQENVRTRLSSLEAKRAASDLQALTIGAALADLYLKKERAEQRLSILTDELSAVQAERARLVAEAQSVRGVLQSLREQVHAQALRASEVQHQVQGLQDRLREEHDLDLPTLYATYEPPAESRDWAAAQDECNDLKKKISRLGNVSLDALTELAELEARSRHFLEQQNDLTQAKQALEQIINKINLDSRKSFVETYQTIRTHFQELFRKLFGGGTADVVLDDENDVLECGIEIIARPPGKELRSISLLSGGEKTLTAVALLLAIFKSKPSPFCILDEVDAALDEANTGRFAHTLKDFLDQSQFIMITHSKRTMAAADVLYGVTMQEAGISKRVAVRLEDWPDESAQPVKRPRLAA